MSIKKVSYPLSNSQEMCNSSNALFWLAHCLQQFASQDMRAGFGRHKQPGLAPIDSPGKLPQMARQSEEAQKGIFTTSQQQVLQPRSEPAIED